MVAIVAMALKTYTTYPILLFCGREAIRSLLLDAGFGHDQRHEVFIRSAIATTWFALSLALSVFIPDIGGVIKILGSFAAVFIFVIPGFGLFTYVNRSDPSTYLLKSKFFLLTSIIFLTLGTFIFGVVLTQAVRYNMVTHPTGGGDDDPHLCVKPVSQIEMSLISSEL